MVKYTRTIAEIITKKEGEVNKIAEMVNNEAKVAKNRKLSTTSGKAEITRCPE